MNNDFYNGGMAGGEVTKSDKSKVAAALLAFFLGTLGIHRFYLGRTGSAVAMLVCTILGYFTLGIMIGVVLIMVVSVWSFVDFIRILCNGLTDFQGRQLS